jgi:hypothetical protein
MGDVVFLLLWPKQSCASFSCHAQFLPSNRRIPLYILHYFKVDNTLHCNDLWRLLEKHTKLALSLLNCIAGPESLASPWRFRRTARLDPGKARRGAG